jgi:hypothetical protein
MLLLSPVDSAPGTRSGTYGARAIGAARSGNVAQVRKEVDQLQAIQKELEPKKKKDEGEYQGVNEELTIAKAWLAHAEGRHDEAVTLLRSIADKEEGEAEASQGIPAHEMLGDMLMDANRPEEALVEYQESLKDPGRFDSLYGAALQQSCRQAISRRILFRAGEELRRSVAAQRTARASSGIRAKKL